MASLFRNKAISIAEFFHSQFFGEPMGQTMKSFLGHLFWSFFGGAIASGIVFAVNILAGRILGPEEYGKYGLVIAISSIFIIPMTLGIETASTHYISKHKEIEDKKKYLNSALLISVPLIFVVTVLLMLLIDFLSGLFNVSNKIIIAAIFFGAVLSLKNILDSFIKGLHLFKFQSIVRIFEALIVALSFFISTYALSFVSVYAYLVAIVLGYLFFTTILLIRLRRYFSATFARSKEIATYSAFAIIGAVSGILLNSFDKILINKYIGTEELGIYNAYSVASILIVSQLLVIFINVFFPFLSSIEDKSQLLIKLNKIFKIIFLPIFILLFLLTSLVVSLFGSEYPFDFLLIFEFGLLATLTAYFTALWWLIASKSKRGIQFTSFNGIISGLIFIALSLFFRNSLNLYLVVLFLIVGIIYAVSIGNIRYGKIK